MTIYYKDKTLPNRFKECRLKAGLSLAELSTALGFKGGKATIGCYERNLRHAQCYNFNQNEKHF